MSEISKINNEMWQFDLKLAQAHGVMCGVDEAGRGPLCGPVCVAAAVLNLNEPIEGVNDSKKLSEKKREALFDIIKEKALSYKIVFIDAATIDELNILNATMLGMKQAIESLDIAPDIALIDGNRSPQTDIKCEYVIKGDAKSASIAAASILAKVSRDRYMCELAKEYPQYKIEQHKGYPTKLHYEMLDKYGIQPFYRKSFLKKKGYV